MIFAYEFWGASFQEVYFWSRGLLSEFCGWFSAPENRCSQIQEGVLNGADLMTMNTKERRLHQPY